MKKEVLKLAMSVLNGGDFVHVGTCSVSAFHSVCVCHVEVSVEDHSSAALFGHVFVPVLGVHVVLAEGTADVVEFRAVQGQDSGEELGLDLLLSSLHGISIDEIALALRMRVQIDINTQSLLVLVVLTELAHGEDCWLFLHIRTMVKPIQILAEDVHAVVSVIHSIGIEHRHQLKHKIFA